MFARMQHQSMLEKRDMYVAVDRKEDEGDVITKHTAVSL